MNNELCFLSQNLPIDINSNGEVLALDTKTAIACLIFSGGDNSNKDCADYVSMRLFGLPYFFCCEQVQNLKPLIR